ncbi:glycosyltransferase [Planctomycetaceae bacterium SH139]
MANPINFFAPFENTAMAPMVVGPPAGQTSGDNRPARETAAIRVLHVINGEFFAGAERVQMHLGKCLPAVGVRADFVCLKAGRFAEQFDLEHSVCFVEPMTSRFDVGVAQRIEQQLGQRSGESSYDLLHAHTPRAALIASRLAKRLGIPWIYHLHSPAARDCENRWKNRINSLVERWALRSVSHLIAVSNSLRRDAIDSGWAAERVTVVHNGVPRDLLANPSQSLTAVGSTSASPRLPVGRSKPVAGQPWRVGMVALMRPRKGLEVALESLALLRGEGRALRFRCIGPFETPAYEAKIKQLVDDLAIGEIVEFIGFTKNISQALSALDFMVLPSLYGEGLPMVVLEAMAAGLPVVATRVEGTPEAIQHGLQGLMAEPNSPSSLAAEMRLLLDGEYDWEQMSRAALHRHAELFSDTAMAAATAEVYRRVLAAPSAIRN